MKPACLFLVAALAGGLSATSRSGIASADASAAPKGPEIATIGTTPAAVAPDPRAKLAEGLRQLELRRTQARQPRPAGLGLSAFPLPPKAAPFETREPARGIRNRFKEVQASPLPAPAAVPAPGKEAAATKRVQP